MPTHPNPYRQQLDRNPANHVPLTPVSLVEWAADVYPERCAVVHGPLRRSWREVAQRSRRLAGALAAMDIGEGDTVAVMLPNTPPMLEAHFALPMTRAVLNSINTRLDAAMVAFILAHSDSKVLIVDREFSGVAAEALAQLRAQGRRPPFVVGVDDPEYAGPGERIGDAEYEAFVDGGDPAFAARYPEDEWDAIGLNYTSGTTGNPKGVVVHHRGAYLNAIANVVAWNLPRHPVYLWTLPMFHCNGWCFPWTLAAVAGTSVCLRKVDAQLIFGLVREHRVSHYCGAPIVHSTLIAAPEALRAGIDWPVKAMVAGAAPPASMIEGMERMGWEVTHVYGLTEVYGPASVCAKQDEWDALPLAERVDRNGRQGVRYQLQQALTVIDPETMREVPRDGETMGEVVFRGNIVMKGYLKNTAATEEAFRGGWFHTGDLGVLHPDGYVKLKDRAKDIIISGGENISSIEVEDALYKHPAVLACAVVARPDEKWGETPLAFVEVKPERMPATPEAEKALADELIEHCRAHLARFKCPREVRFVAVPTTSTGKVQKHLLRAEVKSASAI
ncbi:acyl-CoA synthetase [Quisquiliibacterium transsilvanicum]|uniref:Fatty-acyl-CoA synthase n=1 Tax=Quisquiliibacterium transsilvanicum TaxID=1549638 RepID=A0A7W8HIA3_9BURK|nr:acyl-CoA synthetase [Quisquiliibacterium transsilvanicum]MBB5272574.1 fatty-acyl-CoA synthase [Quisquiliibacterium transsilvanicum]